MHKAKVIAVFLLLISLSFAQVEQVGIAVMNLCGGLKSILPVAAMLMVIIAAVLYAAGQMMGAETRARTNVWATAAVTGALMGILIATVSEPVLETIYYGKQFQCRTPNCPAPPANAIGSICCWGIAATGTGADVSASWTTPAGARKCCCLGCSGVTSVLVTQSCPTSCGTCP